MTMRDISDLVADITDTNLYMGLPGTEHFPKYANTRRDMFAKYVNVFSTGEHTAFAAAPKTQKCGTVGQLQMSQTQKISACFLGHMQALEPIYEAVSTELKPGIDWEGP
jgi:hypothetical protein